MPFPATVKADAMVACGRCCSICHKPCGVKIECHHIIQEKDGGPDTLENCIPLCFDCHAEVGHYNSSHPKGTKFSSDELRRHRDTWFESHAISSPEIHDEERAIDRILFAKIREFFPNNVVSFLKDQYLDHRTSFPMSTLNPLHDFQAFGEDPTAEFLIGDLEIRRADLLEKITVFIDLLSPYIFPHPSHDNRYRFEIPAILNPDLEPEVHAQRIKAINAASTRIFESYGDFVRSGRKILRVE